MGRSFRNKVGVSSSKTGLGGVTQTFIKDNYPGD